MIFGVITVTWCYVWMEVQPTSAFRLSLIPPYTVLVNIMICRVFRNTKLGLYNKVSWESHDLNSPMHAAPNGMISWNSIGNNTTDAHARTVEPIQIGVSQSVEYKNDFPPSTRSKHCSGDCLDFGIL